MRRATEDRALSRWLLIAVAAAFLFVFLFLPVAVIVTEGLKKGAEVFVAAIADEHALSAVKLTLLTAGLVVPINTVFALAAAWAITRFPFKGKNVLLTLVDLPFAVSPVISGMIFVLLFRGVKVFGYPIIFAIPGIVLATTFVTFPFVARELIAFMEAQGKDDEEAALTLGANGLQVFLRVTLPNIKWALAYGMILCNARAMGEFGAVSVVSGHIRGATNTVPLHVEILYNEYNFAAAFAVASLLLLLALVTVIVKRLVEPTRT